MVDRVTYIQSCSGIPHRFHHATLHPLVFVDRSTARPNKPQMAAIRSGGIIRHKHLKTPRGGSARATVSIPPLERTDGTTATHVNAWAVDAPTVGPSVQLGFIPAFQHGGVLMNVFSKVVSAVMPRCINAHYENYVRTVAMTGTGSGHVRYIMGINHGGVESPIAVIERSPAGRGWMWNGIAGTAFNGRTGRGGSLTECHDQIQRLAFIDAGWLLVLGDRMREIDIDPAGIDNGRADIENSYAADAAADRDGDK